jgi:hypothetical protein
MRLFFYLCLHKSRAFLIVDPMKTQFILPVIVLFAFTQMHAQNGIVATAGVSMAYTDNPATSAEGEMISGFHVGLSGRIGKQIWYLKPGIELHVMQLKPEKLLNPFTYDPAMYLLKVPAQIGLKLVQKDNFKLRVAGGFQFSFTTSIDNNSEGLNKQTVKDTQLGALIGAGIDLGPVCIDFNFEKGLTELYSNTGYTADYIFISAGFLF